MEDDYADARTEDDKMPAEANKKRKLKTPAQLQALEEYYEKHKYPTEMMKSEIAEKLGLTEKQVSGWFCHRRLKDKRLSKDEAFGNGKMDRSSGVIQEHGSEPGQDSCGSTKPGGYSKHADLREVESQWLDGQELSPKNVGFHKRMNAVRLDYDMDDTSSETSSPLRPSVFPHHDVPQIRESLTYGIDMPSKSKEVVGNQLRRPSGYLKIIPKAEHPAIGAVKRQLGSIFRQDGPLLGIQFDPLPIDAFQAQAAPKITARGGEGVVGPSNGADSLLYSISGRSSNSGLKMPKGRYRPDDIYLKEQSPVVTNESEACYSNHQHRSKSYTRNNGILHHGWEPSSNLKRDYAEEAYGSKRDISNRVMYNPKGLQMQHISSDHLSPRAKHLTTELTDVPLLDKNVQRSKNFKNQLSKRKLTKRETHDTNERMPYTSELEIETHGLLTSDTSERHNLVTSTAMPDHELTDGYSRPYRLKDNADNNLEVRIQIFPTDSSRSKFSLQNCKLVSSYNLQPNQDKEMLVGSPPRLPDFTKNSQFPITYARGVAAAEISPSSSSSEDDDDSLETSSSDDE